MAQRGRKAKAGIALAVNNDKPEISKESEVLKWGPDAPDDLCDRGVLEWETIVRSMPKDWFTPPTLSILKIHCENVVECEFIQELINLAKKKAKTDVGYKKYSELLKQKIKFTQLVASSATKMRLTQQSTYDAKTGNTAKSNSAPSADGKKKPWEK